MQYYCILVLNYTRIKGMMLCYLILEHFVAFTETV